MKKKYYLLRSEEEKLFEQIYNTFSIKGKKDYFFSLSKQYVSELSKIIKENLDEANTIVKVIPHGEVFERRENLVKDAKTIHLDSLYFKKYSLPLGISRVFDNTGKNLKEIGSRPGYPSIETQIKVLKTKGDYSYVLIEDDIFTGSTINNIVEQLEQNGVKILKVVVGIQAGIPKIDKKVEAAFDFSKDNVVDLVDPRDFLLGTFEGGLVIEDERVKYRAPYFLPFVDPVARASIGKNNKVHFSKEVIGLNKKIYSKLEGDLEIVIKIKDLWKHSFPIVKGLDKNMSVIDYLDEIYNDLI